MVYVLNTDGKPLMPCSSVIAKGNEYFIKGRMATGYAILMDVEGNKALALQIT